MGVFAFQYAKVAAEDGFCGSFPKTVTRAMVTNKALQHIICKLGPCSVDMNSDAGDQVKSTQNYKMTVRQLEHIFGPPGANNWDIESTEIKKQAGAETGDVVFTLSNNIGCNPRRFDKN